MNPPRTGISRESGSVMLRTGPGPLRALSGPAGGFGGPGPCLVNLGCRLLDPAVILDPGPGPVPAAARTAFQLSDLGGPGSPGAGQVLLRQRHHRRHRVRAGPPPRPLPGPELLRLGLLRLLGRFLLS